MPDFFSGDKVNVSESKDKNNDDKTMKRIRANRKKVLMCAIMIDEEAYIDEWVDYHHALGFDAFHLYDNSQLFEMRHWAEEKGDHVKVTHFTPDTSNPQVQAYLNCATNAREESYTWAAFFDIDEFLQLKKHRDVVDFLEEYASSGAIAVNWYRFHPGKGDVLYKPLPVTKRFMYRERAVNHIVKSIAKLSDMDMKPFIHDAAVTNGTLHDTNNHSFTGPYNPLGSTDVAALYHYHIKSHKEYVAKRLRGRADIKGFANYTARVEESQKLFEKALDPHNTNDSGGVYDDSAWEAMKKYAPQYAMFDDLETVLEKNESGIESVDPPSD